MTGDPRAFTFIDTDAGLAAAARTWAEAPVLGLDTEFVRTNTFYHRLGLIQVSAGPASWLVDPLAARDLSPLAAVFRSPGVKVIHSASEDIEVFYRALGVLPEPLFDSQIAGALAGAGAFLSYQKLVAAYLGVELAKEETRTDWMARPLSPGQLAYAAEDVAYLAPLYERLTAELEGLGRLSWVFEDSAALLDTSRFQEDDEAAYLRIKGAGRLDRRQLGALQTLAAWREKEARQRDLPRNFVLKEALLLDLASRRPKLPKDLPRLAAFDARQAARDGATWFELLEQAEARPESELPPRLAGKPFSPAAREVEARLRDKVRERATELNVPPEILAPRRTLDALLRLTVGRPDPHLPEELQGWRREAIGEDLLREALAEERTQP
ncbi:MAG TPA: ribonuclease D [Thermoanaerobaculia bacterium]|jgi:ribonuclease D|nr:ribonuclease D [Thermoanaerobaculia bacterium]